jgi:hypothetical protein
MNTVASFDVSTFASFGSDTCDNIDAARMCCHLGTRSLIWVAGTLNAGVDSYYGAIDPDSPSDFVSGSYHKLTGVNQVPMLAPSPEVAGLSTVLVSRFDGSPCDLSVMNESGATVYTLTGGTSSGYSWQPLLDEVNSRFLAREGAWFTVYPLDLSSSTMVPLPASAMMGLAVGNGKIVGTAMAAASLISYYSLVLGEWKPMPNFGFSAPYYTECGRYLFLADASGPFAIQRLDLNSLT